VRARAVVRARPRLPPSLGRPQRVRRPGTPRAGTRRAPRRDRPRQGGRRADARGGTHLVALVGGAWAGVPTWVPARVPAWVPTLVPARAPAWVPTLVPVRAPAW